MTNCCSPFVPSTTESGPRRTAGCEGVGPDVTGSGSTGSGRASLMHAETIATAKTMNFCFVILPGSCTPVSVQVNQLTAGQSANSSRCKTTDVIWCDAEHLHVDDFANCVHSFHAELAQ